MKLSASKNLPGKMQTDLNWLLRREANFKNDDKGALDQDRSPLPLIR